MEKPTRAATGRDSDKYIVRFPDGMRDQIAELAKANNRSMNAEIVARLQESITDVDPDALPQIKIVLDAGDQPISWDEIHEYMAALRKKMQINDVVLNVTVLAGEHVSSDERDAEVAALAKKLRKKPA
ncbi:Arc family DNA-binding protein [Massilia rubra]|uniref:Arc family DNA-binding protein n=1 Tax=Massilia rubra TaxID=2607910 RepID=A0ABX0LXF3_9BURK|nr:Arc family DNA-binding protein [Massilia rubra]NHZ36562.1 Arc family DNA-binding protein [Massilia rubra]